MARQRGGPKINGQLLIYPVLDASMSTESYRRFADGYGLTRETMSWFWDQYTGVPGSGDRFHPLASPAAADDLSDLPPTHILVAQYDVLRDEAISFAGRLRTAGVATTIEQSDGMLHGFLHLAEAFDDAAPVTERLGRRCREMLSHTSVET
jgi:acetyl esterase